MARRELHVRSLECGLFGTIETGLQSGEDLGDGSSRIPHLAVRAPRAVEMPVDDPGHDHAALEIDHTGLRTDVLLRLLIRAGEEDAPAGDREGLGEFRLLG